MASSRVTFTFVTFYTIFLRQCISFKLPSLNSVCISHFLKGVTFSCHSITFSFYHPLVWADSSGRAVVDEGLRLIACWDCVFESSRGQRSTDKVQRTKKKAVVGEGLWSLAFWDCGFDSRRGHGCLSVVIFFVLSGRDLCDGPITRLEQSYRLWCVI